MQLEILTYIPNHNPKPLPLVFVHGSWHGAWCWEEHFLPYFSGLGYPSYALSLRGHGKSDGHDAIDTYTLSDYAEDVWKTVSTLQEKPVLIGHSMGGAVVQRMLSQNQEQVKAAVLMASAPPCGLRLRDFLMAMLLMRMRYWKMLVLFDKSRTCSKYRNVSFPVNCLFSKGLSEDKKKIYASRLLPDSSNVYRNTRSIMINPEAVNVSVLVLAAENDFFISKNITRRTAKAYKTEPVVFPDIGHDMMLDVHWKSVADRMHQFFLSITANDT
jgi:pimeloyl-ACP methyl ester carboxylesterase